MKNHTNKPNDLIEATSPYLLQHAHNPVQWQVWQDATLRMAQQADKPLLISIGYAACHWCHVMAHESFEDEEIARLMNENFICIKVDREERPDIDQVYMDAVQAMTGSGGWPLHAFALPDGRPFYGGTYFHKEQWRKVLLAVSREFNENRQHLQDYAANLQAGLSDPLPVRLGSAQKQFTPEKLKGMLASWKLRFDRQEGGEERAPKFPLPVNLRFLLDHALLAQDQDVFQHVRLTLDKMALGGIYDQVGGGFARYSTDRHWKVPHFEKMLYDNAQLVSLYSRAYQATRNDLYRAVVEETLEFMLHELKDPQGLFYSSLDADSEGQEGKFYVWKEEELRLALGADFDLAASIFAINPKGLWEDGHYILLREQGLAETADRLGFAAQELQQKMQRIRSRLFEVRQTRVSPALDDKSLASWNCLAVSAFVDAGLALNNPAYLEIARQTAATLLETMANPQGGLYHNFSRGRASVPGFLEDYAFVIEALLALYRATFEEQYLHQAARLMEFTVDHFYDPESAFFFFSSHEDQQLVARKIEVVDGVIPASCSSLAHALFQLSRLLAKPHWQRMALDMLARLEDAMLHSPGSFSNWARLYLTQIFPYNEVVITGDMAHAFRTQFDHLHIPNALLAGSQQASTIPLLQDRFQPGKTLIYVCRDQVCGQPADDVSQALHELGFETT